MHTDREGGQAYEGRRCKKASATRVISVRFEPHVWFAQFSGGFREVESEKEAAVLFLRFSDHNRFRRAGQLAKRPRTLRTTAPHLPVPCVVLYSSMQTYKQTGREGLGVYGVMRAPPPPLVFLLVLLRALTFVHEDIRFCTIFSPTGVSQVMCGSSSKKCGV